MPAQPQFAWRPFELNPDMPAEGIERKAYRARKFGEARSAELDRNMVETGRELGIDFAFDRMQRTPNTRLAHRLIWEADRQGRQDALVERLFHGYFEEALDIGAPEVLKAIAAEAGLEAEAREARADGLRQPRGRRRAGAAGLRPGDPGRAVLHPAGRSTAYPARSRRSSGAMLCPGLRRRGRTPSRRSGVRLPSSRRRHAARLTGATARALPMTVWVAR